MSLLSVLKFNTFFSCCNSGNHIGVSGAHALAKLIATNTSIKHLNLFGKEVLSNNILKTNGTLMNLLIKQTMCS